MLKYFEKFSIKKSEHACKVPRWIWELKFFGVVKVVNPQFWLIHINSMVALLLQQFHSLICQKCGKIEGFLVIFWLKSMLSRLNLSSKKSQFIILDELFDIRKLWKGFLPFFMKKWSSKITSYPIYEQKMRLSSILSHKMTFWFSP